MQPLFDPKYYRREWQCPICQEVQWALSDETLRLLIKLHDMQRHKEYLEVENKALGIQPVKDFIRWTDFDIQFLKECGIGQ